VHQHLLHQQQQSHIQLVRRCKRAHPVYGVAVSGRRCAVASAPVARRCNANLDHSDL
jgi:hypothetical protein